ncbi:MAG: putative SOS response-associated peptidase YedK [Steroidobacteraceae bacterium]|nr:putative SOS response-associated peptidase YedK [Steroidobacteraceae bacterium]
MCGRYVTPDESALEREFRRVPPPFRYRASYNVAPTANVPALRRGSDGAEWVLLRWGLVPFFTHGELPKYPTINARIETLETAASWRGPWKRGQRCILPAAGFYEWRVDEPGRKQPFYIHLADRAAFGFAGLWDRSVSPDGATIESATIITMPANALLADIHNTKQRMPAILAREREDAWLAGTADDARESLVPYPADLMVAHRVGLRVNSPRNDGPDLIAPLAAASSPH